MYDFNIAFRSGGAWERGYVPQINCLTSLVPRPFPPPVFDRMEAGTAWERGYCLTVLIPGSHYMLWLQIFFFCQGCEIEAPFLSPSHRV